jgi:hypothetical protein
MVEDSHIRTCLRCSMKNNAISGVSVYTMITRITNIYFRIPKVTLMIYGCYKDLVSRTDIGGYNEGWICLILCGLQVRTTVGIYSLKLDNLKRWMVRI